MSESILPPTARELRNKALAGHALIRMEHREAQAKEYEQAIGQLREIHAKRYRNWIGVHPEKRHELREVLQRIRDEGLQEVEDVIEILGRQM